MAAYCYKAAELQPNLRGWIEFRQTGEIRKARIVSKAKVRVIVEYDENLLQTERNIKDYNRCLKTGWRFWNKHQQGVVKIWDMG
jgi:hypothetical protein